MRRTSGTVLAHRCPARNRNPHELFAVERQRSADAPPENFTREQYETLVRRQMCSPMPSRQRVPMTPGSRAQAGRPARHGELFRGSRRQRRARSHAHTLGRRPGRPPVCPQPSRLVPHFAGDPDVLNRTVRVNGASFHVVGVMPEGFRGLGPSRRRTTGRRSPFLTSSAPATRSARTPLASTLSGG